jgi:hypothetical protein
MLRQDTTNCQRSGPIAKVLDAPVREPPADLSVRDFGDAAIGKKRSFHPNGYDCRTSYALASNAAR